MKAIKVVVATAVAVCGLFAALAADDLVIEGWSRVEYDGDDVVCFFTNSTLVKVSGSGIADVLLVGGGGGGGNHNTRGGGGGGGDVVYRSGVEVVEGEYALVIGAGGAKGANGGATTAFDLTALGGGAGGADSGVGKNGASGGGGGGGGAVKEGGSVEEGGHGFLGGGVIWHEWRVWWWRWRRG